MEKMQNHYVIVNWNDKGPGLVRQLLSNDLKQKPVVLANCLLASPLPQESQKEQVAFVRAENIDEGLLRKAAVHRAFSIIILTDYGKGGETADAQTILSILTIAKICRQENKRVSIVAELINPQKVSLAEYAGVLGENCVDVEIVSSQYIAQNLLAQVAVTPGLTKVYEDLLTFGEKSSEIYGVPLPSKYFGKTYDELLKSAFILRERNICIVPIAICREGKMHLNPSKTQIDPLRQGDMLYSICDSQAELQNLN